jgi:hypothetical protein
VKLTGERLDADADEGRQRAGLEPGGDFQGSRLRVRVLFGIRSVSVSVLEVDAKILDGLPAKLLDDPRPDCVGEGQRVAGAWFELKRLVERARIRRILLERGQGERTELPGRV